MITATRRTFATVAAAALLAAGISALASDQLASASAAGHAPAIAAPPGAMAHHTGRAVPHAVHPAATVEDHYVAVTPCRVVDTRQTGNKISHGQTKSYYLAGSTGIAQQGGHLGGCGIPVGASAVSLTVTALGETGGGALTIYPAGTARPTARTLSFSSNVAITTSSTMTIANTSAQQLSVYDVASSGSTNLLVDVSGYYVHPIEGLISLAGGSGGVYSGSPAIRSVTNVATGEATVTLDRDVTYCSVSATPYIGTNVYASAYTLNGTTVTVEEWYLDDTTHDAVLYSGYVYLTVTC